MLFRASLSQAPVLFPPTRKLLLLFVVALVSSLRVKSLSLAMATLASTDDVMPATPSPPNLLPILQRALIGTSISPNDNDKNDVSVSSYEITHTIVQGNAVGYKVDVSYSDDRSEANYSNNSQPGLPKQVFVKQVRAVDFVPRKKDWNDMRRTLMYMRTECRFYQMLLQQQQQEDRGGDDDASPLVLTFEAAPKVYLVEYNLGDWIPEDSWATGDSKDTYVEDLNQLIRDNNTGRTGSSGSVDEDTSIGGTIVLECLQPDDYIQASPLTLHQARQCLTAAARLHASSAWQNAPLLELAQARLSRASFSLSVRNPKELAGLEQAWEHFSTAFAEHYSTDSKSALRELDLGRRTMRLAEQVSQVVSPTPTSPFATLIHGDYKAMNVFLPTSTNSKTKIEQQQALLVDFASVGLGLGMSDVAMHVHHAVAPEDLDKHEIDLVRHYWTELTTPRDNNAIDYPWSQAVRHYKYCVVDYFRFFLGRFYKSATPSSMEEKADEPNINMINRNVPAAMRFIRTVSQYLTEVEEEMRATSNSSTNNDETPEL